MSCSRKSLSLQSVRLQLLSMYLRVFHMRIAATKLTLKQQNLFCPAAPNLVQIWYKFTAAKAKRGIRTIRLLSCRCKYLPLLKRERVFFYCKVDSAAEKVPPILVAAK